MWIQCCSRDEAERVAGCHGSSYSGWGRIWTPDSCGQTLLVVMQVIRGLLGTKKYVIVVEHDLSVLDYLSDYICCLYGKPGAYGVVTMPFG